MISTEVDICNHALTILGEERINSLLESSERARMCNLLYEHTRDEVLAVHAWPFATERVSLASVDEENFTAYEYRFAIPSDCVFVIETLYSETYGRINGDDYMIEQDRLFYDSSICFIRYIKRVTNPSEWSDLFATAVTYSLASKLAPRLAQDMGLAMSLGQISGQAIAKAKAQLTKQSLPRPKREMQLTDYN